MPFKMVLMALQAGNKIVSFFLTFLQAGIVKTKSKEIYMTEA